MMDVHNYLISHFAVSCSNLGRECLRENFDVLVAVIVVTELATVGSSHLIVVLINHRPISDYVDFEYAQYDYLEVKTDS